MCQQPKKGNDRSKGLILAKRQECAEQYILYSESEGRRLNSGDITRIDRPLFLRILSYFGSWRTFMRELDAIALLIDEERRGD
jgi:hypothetical protein